MPVPSALPADNGRLPGARAAHGRDRTGAPGRLLRRQRKRGVMSTALLDVSHVSKVFTRGGLFSSRRITAVNDVSFQIDAGRPEIFTIIGESGSGKTTLSRMILN